MLKWTRLAALALIIGLAAALRVWGIGFGLPHDLARPDEEKIAAAALGIARGDLDPHFFLYPSLFIYAAAGAFRVWLQFNRLADPSTLHVIQRAIAAACGVTTVPVLYLAAKELFGKGVGLAAAGFLTVAFLHVRDSHFGVTDVPVTLLIVLAFWSALRCATKGITLARIVVTGALCGLAASTKYNAALVVAPAVITIVTDAVRREHHRLRATAVPLLLLGGCGALAFAAATPFALLDRSAFLADFMAQSRTGLGQRHGSILDAAREVYGGQRGWIHHLLFTLRFGLGMPLLVAGIGGACWLVIRRPLAAALVLSFPVAYYLAMGGSQLVYARWMVPIVPFLCLTAAAFVAQCTDAVTRALGDNRATAPVGVLLAVLIATPTAAQSMAFDRLVTRPDSRVLAAQWIQDRFPDGASVYQTGSFYGFVQLRPADHYPSYFFNPRHGFVSRSGRTALPDVIVVLDSPLRIFSQIDTRLMPILDAGYASTVTFQGVATDDSGDAFDQQDAFFVPFADLGKARRPGPSIRLFIRNTVEP